MLILSDFLVLGIWTRVLLLVQQELSPAVPFSQPRTAMKRRHFPYSFCRQGKETSSPWSARPDSWVLILNLCWIYISRATLFRLNQNTIQQIEEWSISARSACPSGFLWKQLGLFMKQVATSLNMSPSLTDKLVSASRGGTKTVTNRAAADHLGEEQAEKAFSASEPSKCVSGVFQRCLMSFTNHP